MVHSLWVDRIVESFHIERQTSLLAQVLGGKVECPTLDERLAEFEAFLAEEPERFDPAELELRRVLGLRGGARV